MQLLFKYLGLTFHIKSCSYIKPLGLLLLIGLALFYIQDAFDLHLIIVVTPNVNEQVMSSDNAALLVI